MAKTKISEYSATAGSNTDINNINLAEGMAPSLVNNAIRQLMAQLKDFQVGTAGDNVTVGGNLAVTGTSAFTGAISAPITAGTIDGVPIGGTTPAAGAFTTLAASGTTTLGGALVGAATQAAFNTVSTTLNLGGAATAVNIGAATGTATVANTTLAAKAITASTTLAVTGASTLTGLVTATAGVTGPLTSSNATITGGSITGITDLAVADGGTGASTAAGARTSLGLVIGTDVLAPNGSAASLTSFPTLNQNTTGNAATVTTNANLTGAVTSVGNASSLGSFSSANLLAALTDETGTGSAVFATSPVLVTPNLGTPSAAVLTSATGLPLTTGVTGLLPIANGGTATATPSIVAGTNITVTGSWPNQTVTASGGSGTVTSIDVSGGTTGLTTSGGPVTSSGTVTLAGTLAVANGGSGQTSYTNGQLLIGNTTGNTLTKTTLTAGTGVTITNGTGSITIAASGGSGDVVGPASSTDNAITRFDSTTGKLVQNSLVTVADDGAITAPQVGSIIPFYWGDTTLFPSASTYHGAIAHSHNQAAMYFAHGNAWNRLLDDVTDVTVAQGGTGLSTLTANNVIIGNGTSSPLFVAPSSSGNVLTSNGTTWTSSAPAAGGITYTTVKTANYTAVNNDGVQTNTTAGVFTVTLPASPSNGNQVFVVDSFNIWGTNNLTIGRNGSTIEGVAQDLVCDITGVSVQCVYNGTTWDIFAQVGGAGGSVVTGPASSTDNAIARFDLTTGKIIQNSVVTIADTTGNVAGVGTLSLATTLGVGAATPSASGSGITFPATQSASSDANTLDDYEEGTWTPSFSGTSNLTGTPSISNATYTKTGNRVIWQFEASGYSATSSSTSTFFISTFPFTQANIVPGSVIHAAASGATGSMQANNTSSGYYVWAATSSPTSGSVGTLYAFGQSQTT